MSNEVNETEEVGFLDALAGQGFENMEADQTAVPRLLIAQALSEVVANGTVSQGHFYNSITGKDYGDSINVIVCHFQKVWVEWKPNNGGYVGTYPIGGLQDVTGDNYSGMKHGENDVIETWNYLVVLPEHLEDGYLVFGSTRGNLKYLKGWNTQLKCLRTPAGKPAPIFSSVWNMTTGSDTNKNGNKYFSCNKDGKSSITRVGWVTKELFQSFVQPAREIADSAIALADNKALEIEAPEATSDKY